MILALLACRVAEGTKPADVADDLDPTVSDTAGTPPVETGCVASAWYTDADGDGFGDPATREDACAPAQGEVADGTDCDDADPAAHPGADEVCGDLDDDDCDGVADTGAAQVWHSDDDGDGYGHMYVTETTCTPPAGWVLDGSDCRPGDAEAYPGAAERCNDDDDDCDAEVDEDFELDGDGYRSDACAGGDDCDDRDATVNPAGTDACADGVDQDCDGEDAHCGYSGTYDLGASDAKLWSPDVDADAGRWLDVGDMDGDGLDDVLVAAMDADALAGGAWVVPGPVSGAWSLGDVGFRLAGDAGTLTRAGRSLGFADVDGDGYDDLGIGVPYPHDDGVYVVLGPVTGDVDLASEALAFVGPEMSYAGHGTELADVTGDGVADVIVGAESDTSAGAAYGAVYVVDGPISAGAVLADEHDARLLGETANSYTGRHVRGDGDVDGDGIGDLLVAAPYASTGPPGNGIAYLVLGPVAGDLDLASADARLIGTGANDYAGESLVMGDLDGDGYDEAITSSMAPALGTYVGAVYAVAHPSGDVALSSADLAISGSADDEELGYGGGAGGGLAVADADGDGRDDLLVSAGGDATAGAPWTGAAYLFFGPATGALADTDAEAVFLGEDGGDGAGSGVAFADTDGDGTPEVLLGAPNEDAGGANAGAVYLVAPTF